MKYILFLLALILFPGCRDKDDYNLLFLGDLNQNRSWIYLCGLTDDFNSEQEVVNRAILDEIGKKQNIKFIAVKPQNRCEKFDNKLCWPHDDFTELENSYKEVLEQLEGDKIAGFIGFSNGGFFLNQLVQFKELSVPVISIGAAGIVHKDCKNHLYLIIGKKDLCHHEHAINFYKKVKSFKELNVTLIEYDGEHAIPKSSLEELFRNLL